MSTLSIFALLLPYTVWRFLWSAVPVGIGFAFGDAVMAIILGAVFLLIVIVFYTINVSVRLIAHRKTREILSAPSSQLEKVRALYLYDTLLGS